jgi:hypothetical protein
VSDTFVDAELANRTRIKERIVRGAPGRNSVSMEPVIERDEVIALLFNVSDIASELARIREILEEDDGEEADGE